MNIVADDKIPFLKGVLEPFAEVVYLPGDQIKQNTLKNADALLTRSITQCDESLLSNSAVKLIASATIGDDHIDKLYCDSKSIAWSTAKGCNADAVEQYMLSALLRIASENNVELSRQTIGIIGLGNIGSRVQKCTSALGMNILVNDPPLQRTGDSEKYCSIQQLQEEADIVTFHVPLTFGGLDKTFHLADEAFFEGFEKSIFFINTSRGGVVDSEALKNTIHKGKVKSAVIDVWENEPFIDQKLLDMVRIGTPHIAGYSRKGKANSTAITVQTVSRFFDLGLENWHPDFYEERKTIELDCSTLNKINVLSEIMTRVYQIQGDTEDLLRNPDQFEHLRRNYKYRQENGEYELKLKNADKELISWLEAFGFNTTINFNNQDK